MKMIPSPSWRRRMKKKIFITFFTLALAACGDTTENQPAPPPGGSGPSPHTPGQPETRAIALSYDFNKRPEGWMAGFADYSVGMTGFEFESGLKPIPLIIDREVFGYYLKSKNISDDLFMFIKRKISTGDGVRADTSYDVKYSIILASNAPSGCIGAGGAPGESVYLKAGASPFEPLAIEKEEMIRMNVDIGNQATGGNDATVAGNIANGIKCEDAGENPRFVTITRSLVHTKPVKSSSDGSLWLLIGTDSGFEGTTQIFFQRVDVTLTPR
jgi:hypothetical protein